MNVPEAIKYIRDKNCLTNKDIIINGGISETAFYSILYRKNKSITLTSLKLIAKGLNVKIYYLVAVATDFK